MFKSRSRMVALTLTIAVTVPITTLSAKSQSLGGQSIPGSGAVPKVNTPALPTGGLKPVTDLGSGTSEAPPKQSVVQDNLSVPPRQTDILKPGASLGGPGSNQILEPPINGLNPVSEANQNINTGLDALNQSLTTKGEFDKKPGDKWVHTNPQTGEKTEYEYLGEGQDGERVFRNNTEGFLIVNDRPTEQQRLDRAQKEAANNLADPESIGKAQEEAGEALNAPDPAETAKSQEEAAGALDGGEPSGSGGSDSSGSSGSARSPEEEAAEGLDGEPGGSGSGSKASGGGSEGIFQDPTKGGAVLVYSRPLKKQAVTSRTEI